MLNVCSAVRSGVTLRHDGYIHPQTNTVIKVHSTLAENICVLAMHHFHYYFMSWNDLRKYTLTCSVHLQQAWWCIIFNKFTEEKPVDSQMGFSPSVLITRLANQTKEVFFVSREFQNKLRQTRKHFAKGVLDTLKMQFVGTRIQIS